jgi:hypothetical protein
MGPAFGKPMEEVSPQKQTSMKNENEKTKTIQKRKAKSSRKKPRS